MTWMASTSIIPRYPENAPDLQTPMISEMARTHLAQWRRDNITKSSDTSTRCESSEALGKGKYLPCRKYAIPPVTFPADGMLFTLFTKMHKVGWVKAYNIRYIHALLPGNHFYPFALTGRNK